jgi:hypothetical protein
MFSIPAFLYAGRFLIRDRSDCSTFLLLTACLWPAISALTRERYAAGWAGANRPYRSDWPPTPGSVNLAAASASVVPAGLRHPRFTVRQRIVLAAALMTGSSWPVAAVGRFANTRLQRTDDGRSMRWAA